MLASAPPSVFARVARYAHQFRVEISGLPVGTVKPALRVTSACDNELSFDRHHPCHVQAEALSRTEPPDDKANACSSPFDPLEIIQDSGDFIVPEKRGGILREGC